MFGARIPAKAEIAELGTRPLALVVQGPTCREPCLFSSTLQNRASRYFSQTQNLLNRESCVFIEKHAIAVLLYITFPSQRRITLFDAHSSVKCSRLLPCDLFASTNPYHVHATVYACVPSHSGFCNLCQSCVHYRESETRTYLFQNDQSLHDIRHRDVLLVFELGSLAITQ